MKNWRKDMRICRLDGQKIYYTYGNHNKNNYLSTPNYTVDQLAQTINENNIQILEDDTTVINDEIVLIGRANRGDGNESR